jgi:hypothetical protein
MQRACVSVCVCVGGVWGPLFDRVERWVDDDI